MEGHLTCLKFIVSTQKDISTTTGARNDQGDTPRSLAEQFFKQDCCHYLDALEWEHDHPEQAESEQYTSKTMTIVQFSFDSRRSCLSGTCCRIQW
jgi:hypothetical protein